MTTAPPRRLLSPLFAVAGAFMLIFGAGLPPAISALQQHFAKAPIELRRSLHEFDLGGLPSWIHASELNPPPVDPRAVGTGEYLFEAFRPREPIDPTLEDARFVLLVTYYSDPRDTIPHTPEVCYRQSGSTVEHIGRTTVDLPGIGPSGVRVLDISQRGREMVVLYFICHNGLIFEDRETARFAMGWPGDRHTYFTKVEVAVGIPRDAQRDQVVEQACSLLAESFAELRRTHYPTDDAVR